MGDSEKNGQASGRGRGGGGGGAARSWGTAASGQSVSTTSGGSTGSPSSLARVSHGDEVGNKKKKRGQRVTTGDKSGRGLRQFSMKVCEKVESRGRTTYNEVADELVAEFADPGNRAASPDQQQYEEKNIRRRVYDALNVLMAMDIISKDKKEITWKGLPRTSQNNIEQLKKERQGLRSRIEKKAAYLQEHKEQYVGLQNLI